MLAGHGNPGGIAQPATTSIEASSNEKSYSLAAVRCDSRIFGFGTRLAYVMTGWLPRVFTHPICDRFQSLRLERPVASGDMSRADNLQKVVCYLDGSHRFPTDSPQIPHSSRAPVAWYGTGATDFTDFTGSRGEEFLHCGSVVISASDLRYMQHHVTNHSSAGV